MARKLFISFLGATNYFPCDYTKDGVSQGKNRFIQIPTLYYLINSAPEDGKWLPERDKIIILLTEDAEKKNWVDDGQIDHETNLPIIQNGLESELEKADFGIPFEAVKGLPPGNDEEEIWEIFQRIYALIEEGDELYFDITHGFRYLPMLIVTLGDFCKYLKNTTVKSLTYGNYEASQRGKIPGPIVDLLPLNAIMDWTNAASQFTATGNTSRLKELSDKETEEQRATSKEAQNIRSIVTNIDKLVTHIKSCRGMELIKGSLYVNISQKYPLIEKNNRPLNLIIKHIMDSLSPLSEHYKSSLVGLEVAKWCLNYNMYHQAATILRETVISYLCEIEDVKLYDKVVRESEINDSLRIKTNKTEKDFVSPLGQERRFEIVEHLKTLPLVQNEEFVQTFNNLKDLRNDIDHAGMRQGPFLPKTIDENLKKYLDTLAKILHEDSQGKTMKLIPESNPIFINLSNHPSSKWTEEQLSAAKLYGDIIDIRFPIIDPLASSADVKELVMEFLNKIQDLGSDPENTTIHVTGEMNFTFALVCELKARGYTCVAATTIRDSYEDPDGNKVSRFSFAQFREY